MYIYTHIYICMWIYIHISADNPGSAQIGANIALQHTATGAAARITNPYKRPCRSKSWYVFLLRTLPLASSNSSWFCESKSRAFDSFLSRSKRSVASWILVMLWKARVLGTFLKILKSQFYKDFIGYVWKRNKFCEFLLTLRHLIPCACLHSCGAARWSVVQCSAAGIAV